MGYPRQAVLFSVQWHLYFYRFVSEAELCFHVFTIFHIQMHVHKISGKVMGKENLVCVA